MGTVTQKLQNILDCKVDIADAITSKGVPCDKDGILSEYADKIKAIEVVEPAEPKVGDIRKEGIVVYVDPANPKRFLLMSKDEYNLAWRTGADAATKIDGLTLDNGKKNCEIIWSLPEYTSSPESFPTFKAAKDYKDGKWFVPSRGELDHVFEYLLDWHRGDKMGWPTPMPNYNKEEAILSSWESAGLLPIDVSSSTGVYWVSSQWETKPNWWGEGVSESTFTSNGITGGDPTTTKHVRFFKWVEPEAIKPKSYGGYTKDPNWPDFLKEMEEDSESFDNKLFAVVTDVENTTTFSRSYRKIVTSDGAVYNKSADNVLSTVHTWDTTKDLRDSKGNVIRWVKCYANLNNNGVSIVSYPKGAIYVVTNSDFNTSSNNSNNNVECLEVVGGELNTISYYTVGFNMKAFTADNVIDGVWYPTEGATYVGPTMSSTFSLKYPVAIHCSSDMGSSTLTAIFKEITLDCPFTNVMLNSGSMRHVEVVRFGTNAVPSATTAIFTSNATIREVYIESLNADLAAAMNLSNSFYDAVNLNKLVIPKDYPHNINLNNAVNLRVSCLVDILNNLKDKTRDSAAGVLTLGTKNLAKLSDEEKLIAINKNWTLS